eukprot:3941432-Rhodomonas_salina.11
MGAKGKPAFATEVWSGHMQRRISRRRACKRGTSSVRRARSTARFIGVLQRRRSLLISCSCTDEIFTCTFVVSVQGIAKEPHRQEQPNGRLSSIRTVELTDLSAPGLRRKLPTSEVTSCLCPAPSGLRSPSHTAQEWMVSRCVCVGAKHPGTAVPSRPGCPCVPSLPPSELLPTRPAHTRDAAVSSPPQRYSCSTDVLTSSCVFTAILRLLGLASVPSTKALTFGRSPLHTA